MWTWRVLRSVQRKTSTKNLHKLFVSFVDRIVSTTYTAITITVFTTVKYIEIFNSLSVSDFALVNSLEDRLSSLEASVSDYNALLFETSKRKIAKKSSPRTIGETIEQTMPFII